MSDIRKILVIKLKHIGDVLLAAPVCQALHEKYPDAHIAALVPRGTEEMLANNPHVQETLIFDRAVKKFSLSSLLRAEWWLLREIRRRRFDLVVELSGGDRGAILAFCSGAPIRLGYRRRKGLWGRDCLFTRVVDSDFRKSVVESHGDILRGLGIAGPMPHPRLTVLEDLRARAGQLLQEAGIGPHERFVVFHPTSRWMFKSWDAASCARLAEHLIKKWECRVVFTCGPEEKEKKKIRQIMALVKESVVNLSGKTSLALLGGVLARSCAFIGVDSAPMHMAAALGVPTLSLFGPSDPVQWAPAGPRNLMMQKGWACQPCGRDGCFSSKISQCLTELSAEEVAAAVDRWLPAALADKH